MFSTQLFIKEAKAHWRDIVATTDPAGFGTGASQYLLACCCKAMARHDLISAKTSKAITAGDLGLLATLQKAQGREGSAIMRYLGALRLTNQVQIQPRSLAAGRSQKQAAAVPWENDITANAD